MPGYDIQTKEITRRFAAEGYNAVMPNLYWREAPGASPDDAAATARAAGGVPDERLVGDVAGAMSYLKALPAANGKVGVIGYCSGGRQSFLAAVSLPLDAAVDCYGAFVVGTPPEGMPLKVGPIVDKTPQLSCPLLGLFGAEDSYPSPEQVKELEDALKAAGKTYEFHSYEGAGHAFFSVNRPSYRPEAANDGWDKILEFYGKYLAVLSRSPLNPAVRPRAKGAGGQRAAGVRQLCRALGVLAGRTLAAVATVTTRRKGRPPWCTRATRRTTSSCSPTVLSPVGGLFRPGRGGPAGDDARGRQAVCRASRRNAMAWAIAAFAAWVPRSALSITKSWMMPW
jgi:carboxymethylenebutenolidase